MMDSDYYSDFRSQSANNPTFKEDDYSDFRSQSANYPTFKEDDYGFFCDLETAKTMEYEKVEYYVVKVSTKYEVRKKPIGIGEKPPNMVCISELADEPPPCLPQPTSHLSSCCCINIKTPEKTSIQKQPIRENFFYSTFAFLARLPRDVYYSFTVCTVTATCVYITMTVTNT